jgi:subtilisin
MSFEGRLLLSIIVLVLVPRVVLEAGPGQEDRPSQWALRSRPQDAPLSMPQFNDLASTLRAKGQVRLIVRLRQPLQQEIGFALEAAIGDERSKQEQRAVIKDIQERVIQRLSRGGISQTKRFHYIPYMAVTAGEYDFQALLNSPEVDFIGEDIAVPPLLMQSVPLIGGGSDGTFSGYSGAGMTVAILDTGVDSTHPFLTGKVVDEACYSTSDGNSQSACPDGQTSQTGVGAAVPCSFDPACDHGTHVAGIAAGRRTDISGLGTLSGVAKDASIMAIQVFSNVSGQALSYSSDQIAALEHVYALKDAYSIASVNMSLGGGAYTSNCDALSPAFKAAVDNLRSVGIATVVASGNSGYLNATGFPACISSVLSVGATDKSDQVAAYSNSVSFLSLLAPGSVIYSSLPGGNYGAMSGTSMATPHVTGSWAVLKSKNRKASVDQVLSALTNTGVSIVDTRNGLTKPRIEVDSALSQIPQNPISILWRNTDGRLLAWNMSGPYFLSSTPLNAGKSIPTAWSVAGVGDLNKDGNVDILWHNADGRVLVWLMNGVNFIGSAWLNNGNPVNTAWSAVGVGDFNKDGNEDILWHNVDGRITVWNMNGTNFVSATALNNGNPVNTAWSVAGVADFNKDGNLDILWRNSDGRALVWLMNGTSFLSGVPLNAGKPVSTVWSVAGIADIDGDGNADILWHNTDGRVLVWLMNGTSFASAVWLNNGNPVNTAWNVAAMYTP